MGKLEYQNSTDQWTQTRSVWDRLLGPDRRKVWVAFAREIGGEYSEWGPLADPTIVAPLAGAEVRLRRARSGGRTRSWHLYTRATYANPDGFRFSLGPRPLLMYHVHRLETEDKSVDRALAFSSNDPQRVIAIFRQTPAARELVACGRQRQDPRIRLRDAQTFFGWPRAGLVELHVSIEANTRDAEQLRAIVQLTKAVLEEVRR